MKAFFSYILPLRVQRDLKCKKLLISQPTTIEKAEQEIRYFLLEYFQCSEEEITASVESIKEEKSILSFKRKKS